MIGLNSKSLSCKIGFNRRTQTERIFCINLALLMQVRSSTHHLEIFSAEARTVIILAILVFFLSLNHISHFNLLRKLQLILQLFPFVHWLLPYLRKSWVCLAFHLLNLRLAFNAVWFKSWWIHHRVHLHPSILISGYDFRFFKNQRLILQAWCKWFHFWHFQ